MFPDLSKQSRAFIIAELSANHNNDFDLAVKTIRAIADSGADAVKVQTFKPESLSINADNEYFGPKTEGLWKGYRPYDLYKKAMMPWEWQPKLKTIAEELGLQFFSSPFDKEAVDFLDGMNVPAYKIASFEITDIPLIAYAAAKGKPIIISTGIATLADIELAVNTCRQAGNNQITLLKCTSEYPAPFELANLATIPHLKQTFSVEVGLSDHTMGAIVPIVAVTLGAKVIEKHFILSRDLGGPDSAFSMEPQEFTFMIKSVREAEVSLGKINYEVSEKNKLRRRSLFATKDIVGGETFTDENIASVRPGNGLHPIFYYEILGKKAKEKITKGTPLNWNLISNL
ncbi:MAG TPA: pseudaminic acid synthase [Parafilimonas sp.]|nr:pseudaminic acid synthase [Parafilimonas sp.]